MRMNKSAGFCLAFGACVIVGLAANTGRSQPSSAPPSISPTGGAGHPVATVDVVRIFSDTAQIKDLNEHMRQKTEDYAAELKTRSEALNTKKVELQAFKPGTADYEQRRKELFKLNAEAMAWSKATEDDLDQQKFDWTVEIYKLAIDSAGKVAKARGFDVVVQRTEFKPADLTDRNVQALRSLIQNRTVIFSVPEVDITDDVIRAMDQTYNANRAKSAPRPTPPGPPPAPAPTPTPNKPKTP